MTTKKLLIAYVVVLVVALAYEFLVYGVLLDPAHKSQPGFMKAEADISPVRMLLTSALSAALFTVFYALFARGRASSVSTGLVFGVFMGLLAGWIPQAYNKMLLVNWPFYLEWASAGFGEAVVLGVTLGLVYRE